MPQGKGVCVLMVGAAVLSALVVFFCPHHDIGREADLTPEEVRARQEAEFLHHGDKTLPPRQG